MMPTTVGGLATIFSSLRSTTDGDCFVSISSSVLCMQQAGPAAFLLQGWRNREGSAVVLAFFFGNNQGDNCLLQRLLL
ncbi:hypothetical protein AAC387_Pa11g1444 [Persea americana]